MFDKASDLEKVEPTISLFTKLAKYISKRQPSVAHLRTCVDGSKSDQLLTTAGIPLVDQAQSDRGSSTVIFGVELALQNLFRSFR